MRMSEAEFEKRLTAALHEAARLDYMETPADAELESVVQPSPQFQRKMRLLLKNPSGYAKKLKKPMYLRVVQNVAAVFIACTILLGGAMAVSPTVRAAVVEFVSTWLEGRTAYTANRASKIEGRWTFGYIPEGLELAEEMTHELQHVYFYTDGGTRFVAITISTGRGYVDNENSTFYQTEINGRAADVYERISQDDGNIIVMYDNYTGLIIYLTGSVDIEELVKVAENMSN